MRSVALVVVIAFAPACDALRLDLGPAMDGGLVGATRDVEAQPTEVSASPCVTACVGGRRCEAGACVPHWLPIRAGEGVNDGPRVGHFVVWTGREVLLWGGRAPGGATPLGDGVRFDPSRGEMRAMSRIDAPAARIQDGAAAVWTGEEMLVVGGRDAQGALRDAALYSPSLDRWRTLATGTQVRSPLTAFAANGEVLVLTGSAGGVDGLRLLSGTVTTTAPSNALSLVRTQHSALWTGAEVIVWGGADASGAARADGYRYLPSRGRLRAMRDQGMRSARRGHSAVWSSSEMLVFGGVDARGDTLAAPASYVPALDAWRVLSDRGAPSPRREHAAVWAADAMIIWGGRVSHGLAGDGAAYDPWDDAWTPLPPLPDAEVHDGSHGARAQSAAVWTGSELIVLAGDGGGSRLDPYGWRYQP